MTSNKREGERGGGSGGGRGGRGGGEVVMHFQHPDGFNPNDVIYKTCCCHAKTFTIVMGIFEIFTVCFLLVAVLPDVTTRVCDKLTNDTEILDQLEEFEFSHVRNTTYVSSVLCHNNILCLIWAAVQIFAVNVMFYGIKTIRFWLFIPHMIFRIWCIIVVITIEAWMVYLVTGGIEDATPWITAIAFVIGGLAAVLYATWIEVRCAHFIKRSRDTGFSISVARPLGPATISLTDNPPTDPAPRRLPPLRNTRNHNQYVVNELPKVGNPNETGA